MAGFSMGVDENGDPVFLDSNDEVVARYDMDAEEWDGDGVPSQSEVDEKRDQGDEVMIGDSIVLQESHDGRLEVVIE